MTDEDDTLIAFTKHEISALEVAIRTTYGWLFEYDENGSFVCYGTLDEADAVHDGRVQEAHRKLREGTARLRRNAEYAERADRTDAGRPLA